VFYRVASDDVIEVVRLLHDAILGFAEGHGWVERNVALRTAVVSSVNQDLC